MPIPTPKPTETQKEFVQRCMSDEIMNNEYPDKDQRYSVCIMQYKKK
jgi:hypothetical protein